MKTLVHNKKAWFDYEITDTLEAGIVLVGHEVKALKTQWGNLRDAIVKLDEKEIWLINLDIPIYKNISRNTLWAYNPKWRRKLLLTKRQIIKLAERTNKTGLHIIPLKLREDKNRRIKLTIWLAKRKKNIQKRHIIKERDISRQMDKDIKNYR